METCFWVLAASVLAMGFYRSVRPDPKADEPQPSPAEAALEALARANRVRSELMARISHEFRTPLHGILGTVELLSSEAELSKEHGDMLLQVRESGTILLDLVDEFLVHASLENNPGPPPLERVCLHRLITSVTDTFASSASRRDLEFSVQIRDSVPMEAISHGRDLQRIVRSYLSNAFRYTENGGIHLSVSGWEGDLGRYTLRIEVRDSGSGIPKDRISEVFEPFAFDELSTPSRLGSHGLGLPIVKRLVERHGGECGCQSALGKGSLFWAEVEVGLAGEEARLPKSEQEGMSVLVVDDDLLNRKLAKRMLENLGCARIALAADGEEAISQWRSQPFDLILMDCQMPGLDGHEATMAIRRLEAQLAASQRTPIVALTANVLDHERQRAFNSGMDHFLTKPVTRAELEQVIADLASD